MGTLIQQIIQMHPWNFRDIRTASVATWPQNGHLVVVVGGKNKMLSTRSCCMALALSAAITRRGNLPSHISSDSDFMQLLTSVTFDQETLSLVGRSSSSHIHSPDKDVALLCSAAAQHVKHWGVVHE